MQLLSVGKLPSGCQDLHVNTLLHVILQLCEVLLFIEYFVLNVDEYREFYFIW